MRFSLRFVVGFLLSILSSICCAQTISVLEPSPEILEHGRPAPHAFFDRQNLGIFSVEGVAIGLDGWRTHLNFEPRPYYVCPMGTCHVAGLRVMAEERNPLARPFVTRGTAWQIAYFSADFAGNIGLAYLLHKTHHHRIERWISAINLGLEIPAISTSWSGQ